MMVLIGGRDGLHNFRFGNCDGLGTMLLVCFANRILVLQRHLHLGQSGAQDLFVLLVVVTFTFLIVLSLVLD